MEKNKQRKEKWSEELEIQPQKPWRCFPEDWDCGLFQATNVNAELKRDSRCEVFPPQTGTKQQTLTGLDSRKITKNLNILAVYHFCF